VRRALATALMLTATLAHAGPRSVLVLRAEGTADTASRTSVDGHVLRMAKHLDGKVDAGDITLSDAAAAAGCNAAEASCKDEILMTFAVDEMVTTTVTAGPNGQLNVTVRRLSKGTAPKTAQTTLSSARAPEAKLDNEIGPLFGLAATQKPVEKPAEKPAEPPPPAPVDTAPPLVTTAQPPVATTEPAAMQPQPQPMAPEGVAPNRKKEKIGMAIGGGVALLGILMWSAASSKQGEIDDAPANTPADFAHLQELEKDADGLAGGGNLFFVGGVIIVGVSSYLYWRKGRQARTQTTAVLAPTMFPHGAGLVLTFGGSR
jgi:hypothetical protein